MKRKPKAQFPNAVISTTFARLRMTMNGLKPPPSDELVSLLCGIHNAIIRVTNGLTQIPTDKQNIARLIRRPLKTDLFDLGDKAARHRMDVLLKLEYPRRKATRKAVDISIFEEELNIQEAFEVYDKLYTTRSPLIDFSNVLRAKRHLKMLAASQDASSSAACDDRAPPPPSLSSSQVFMLQALQPTNPEEIEAGAGAADGASYPQAGAADEDSYPQSVEVVPPPSLFLTRAGVDEPRCLVLAAGTKPPPPPTLSQLKS